MNKLALILKHSNRPSCSSGFLVEIERSRRSPQYNATPLLLANFRQTRILRPRNVRAALDDRPGIRRMPRWSLTRLAKRRGYDPIRHASSGNCSREATWVCQNRNTLP
jgi:hypothetical protein